MRKLSWVTRAVSKARSALTWSQRLASTSRHLGIGCEFTQLDSAMNRSDGIELDINVQVRVLQSLTSCEDIPVHLLHPTSRRCLNLQSQVSLAGCRRHVAKSKTLLLL